MKRYIHESAEVHSKLVGENTQIWQFTVILEGAEIGNDCNINSHCFIENKVKIGNRVTVKCGNYLWDGIYIEDDVFIGPNVTFTNDKYPRSKQEFQVYSTRILKGATIGAASTILGGVQIGQYAMIGAGSLVTKNIPPFTLWYGNPAVQKGYVTISGEILDHNLTSKDGKKYSYSNDQILPL
ncbi:MAG: N-acetyltransferase [Bacteroidales bacterium]|nr:N-acetyltransferase [Bacteroidales bacterium]